MFSGIIEAQSDILRFAARESVLEIAIARPFEFDDIKIGDSIAVNGVCLTVEKQTPQELIFAVGPETLAVTNWDSEKLQSPVNLERSLKYGDRLHGHLVTGHVDGRAQVTEVKEDGEALLLEVEVPQPLAPFIWRKGSIALNGVSLTVNNVVGARAQLCLIPETIKKTNLARLRAGSHVNLEVDNWARGLLRIKDFGLEHHT
jgi:riboflavin synthase